MNKKILLLIALFVGLTINAQSYTFSLVYNSGYNFSVTATPDYSKAAPFPTLAQSGFTLLVPDGVTLGPVTGYGLTYSSAPYLSLPAPHGVEDAFNLSVLYAPIVDLPEHVAGTPIVVATFDVLGTPTTGNLTLLDNASSLALAAGGIFDSFFLVEPTGDALATATNLYVGQSGTTSFAFNTLSTASNELDKVAIYPNPVKNVLNIKGLGNVLEKAVIYNVNGQKVITQTSNLETINTSELTAGIYFVQLESANSTKTIKLIKE
ncbi:T9SS type A sorting domain-containing protein [Aurantibacter sp.]|uniref:T9SS type A sorting domain-containing protein n=1 Tax=Aurantibacter sp. TaxID=2807103 RepID=UPI0035C7CCE8